ncbi:MAG TPA: nucleotidyltransferase [Syntrophomonadaceae bacterium]|nr:nucleotidyltransferase [Syntrophomonadaceae bacterium]HPU47801.1 nucleotidyltransferase [Syntrophomonadaceae bacterium]
MIVTGIVAEYNPFHNGHRYLIESVRRLYPEAAIICVMSGHFLQRGEPALVNKWARAEMAVSSGADLIIELPLVFSVRSAYYFARSALMLLSQTGLVTHLAFGSESGDCQELKTIAHLLADEPAEYRDRLKAYLSQGYSFPVARSYALRDWFKDDPHLEHLLSQPNNILALEYLRVIKELQLNIEPIAVKRQGSFHSTDLSPFASATAIRQFLMQGNNIAELRTALPLPSSQILEREIERGAGPVFDRDLSSLILYRLRTLPLEELGKIYEITEGLEYRIKESAQRSSTLDQLRQSIKSKRYNMTKINRLLIYALLNISARQMEAFDETGPLYHRVLAFSSRGQQLLQQMQRRSSLPIFSRGSQVKAAFDGKWGPAVKEMITQDIMATDVYALALPNHALRRGGLDFTASPVRVTGDSSPTTGE